MQFLKQDFNFKILRFIQRLRCFGARHELTGDTSRLLVAISLILSGALNTHVVIGVEVIDISKLMVVESRLSLIAGFSKSFQ